MSDVHQFSAHELDTLAAVLDQVIPPIPDPPIPGPPTRPRCFPWIR